MACHHCFKLIQLFEMRFKAITFQNTEVRTCLEGLKFSKRSNWQQDDVDYLVTLYLTSDKRQQKVMERVQVMEQKIIDRNLKLRIKKQIRGTV